MSNFEGAPVKPKKDDEPNQARRSFLKSMPAAVVGGVLAGRAAIGFSEFMIAEKLSCKGFKLVPVEELSIIDDLEKRAQGAQVELILANPDKAKNGEVVMEAVVKLSDGSEKRGYARGFQNTASMEKMASAAIMSALEGRP